MRIKQIVLVCMMKLPENQDHMSIFRRFEPKRPLVLNFCLYSSLPDPTFNIKPINCPSRQTVLLVNGRVLEPERGLLLNLITP